MPDPIIELLVSIHRMDATLRRDLTSIEERVIVSREMIAASRASMYEADRLFGTNRPNKQRGSPPDTVG